MVEHLVLVKFKPNTAQGQIDTFMERVRPLKDKIEGVVDLTVGTNFTDRSQGFTHGLCVRVADKAALEGYLAHPEHVAVVESCMKPILEDVIAVDYEF